MRLLRFVRFLPALILLVAGETAYAQTPVYGYTVVRQFPHDTSAFTQGLILENGTLFEGTGLYGSSSLREVDLVTGAVNRRVNLDGAYFGEGITIFQGKLFQLTWREYTGFIYDPATFALLGQWTYAGEGWGLTHDAQHLIMSDGTNRIRFLDPVSLATVRTIDVSDQGSPVTQINELEYVNGEIFANIWQTDLIARIDPASGSVRGWIDMHGLLPPGTTADVLNGIAYDAASGNLLVTGKFWPALFEVIITGGAPSNGSPTATDLSASLPEDTSRDITLVATDPDGDQLSYAIVQTPAHGTLSGGPPNVRYTPTANYTGTDAFSYKANDGMTDSNVATVSLAMSAVNDPPVSAADAYSTAANTTLTVGAPGVLANDGDVDNSVLSAAVVNGVAHGSLTLSASGAFSYTPVANYSGGDSFTYRASDGAATSAVTIVTLTVTAPPPSGNPAVSLSTTALSFGNEPIGVTSAARQVRLTNTGSAQLIISNITITGAQPADFARTTTCGTSLAAGASCDISVTFKPTATGARKAVMSILDTAAGSPHVVSLSGSGKKSGR